MSLLFLRFDLTTVIVAHFAYNAGLGALPLLRSGEPHFVASGVVVLLAMLAPTMPYLFRELRRRLRSESRVTIHPRIRTMVDNDRQALEKLSLDDVDWAECLGDSNTVALGLEAGEEIVGAAIGRMGTEKEALVLMVYVNPTWRRRYWGSKLLVKLNNRLQERGAETIHTQVDVDDKRAMRFMFSQPWRQARVIFDWPSKPPTFPGWRRLLEKLGLRREEKHKAAKR